MYILYINIYIYSHYITRPSLTRRYRGCADDVDIRSGVDVTNPETLAEVSMHAYIHVCVCVCTYTLTHTLTNIMRGYTHT